MTTFQKSIAGRFSLTDDREVFGSLYICGESSKAELYDDTEFQAVQDAYSYIYGELHDGRKVSLLQCNLIRIGKYSDGSKHSAEVFPHFVAIGPDHIPQSAPCITTVAFVMEDATAIFYDFDAFSTIRDTEPFIPLLRNDTAKFRKIQLGDRPIIAYFTGKFEIAVVETEIGEVRTEHRPTVSSGGPNGVRIDNEVVVSLRIAHPVSFQDAMRRLSILLRFFEMIAGRTQSLRKLSMKLVEQPDHFQSVEVYPSFAPPPNVDGEPDDRRAHPADVLVSTIHGTKQYSTVLKNYVASDPERHDGRVRLQNSIKDSRLYTIDRLIAAANLFDIFPNTAYPEKTSICSYLSEAKKQARKLFLALPDSIERSAILSALGRIGTLSLKHKIRHRVSSTGLGKHFSLLIEVLEEAVNCRNHYVHGTPGRVDYSANSDVLFFFTDSLEFAFAASDLIDCGWDFLTWKARLPGHSHPFAHFLINYPAQLQNYKEQLGKSKEMNGDCTHDS